MEQERFSPDLDDLLSDIHRLIDEDGVPENLTETPEYNDDFDFTGLFDELPEEEPLPEPEPAPEPQEQPRWTQKQKVPKHVAKLQQNEEQAYADWLYAQEHPEEAPQPVQLKQTEQFQQLRPTRWADRQKVPRHVAKLQQNQDEEYAKWLYEQDQRGPQPPPVFVEETETPKKKKRKKKAVEPEPEIYQPPKKKRHGFRNFLIFLLVLTLAVAAAVVFLLPEKPVGAGSAGRRSGVSTILLVGTDAGGQRTDTLMLLSMNRSEGTISLVSIPRDTLVNGNYTVPKINSVYGANNGGYEGMEMLMTRVKQCIGFWPDGYILLQLDAFVEFVDVLGGVEFDVPVDMFYNDPTQDLHIALEAGKQMLSGEEALGLVRFRSGYADADLGRVQVQRDFLSALIDQAVSAEGVAKSPLLLNVLQSSTQTNLNARNFLWLAESVLFVDVSSIETVTLPGSARNWESGSYYVLDPASVAQTVNSYCNPFAEDVTVEDLEIRIN